MEPEGLSMFDLVLIATYERTIKSGVVYWVVALLALVLSAPAVNAQQPNILFLLADDLGWADLSGGHTNFGNGSDFYETPNIERMANQGMSFTSMYAAQNCLPSRVALLTGQYAPRNGVYNVGSLNRSGDQTPLIGPSDSNSIRADAITLAETLKAAGYTTAHFGKFHATASAADIIEQYGFDFNFGGTQAGSPSAANGYFAVEVSPGIWQYDDEVSLELDAYAQPYTQQYIDETLRPYANGANVDALVGTPKHLTDALTDAAIDFMRMQQGSGQPFFMNFAYYLVHAPKHPRPDLLEKYRQKRQTNPSQIDHDNIKFAAMVEGLDQSLGRIFDFLQDPNGDGDISDSLAANTLTIFSSDNGGTGGSEHNAPLTGIKGTHTEGGLRVPMVAWRPGTIPAGVVSNAMANITDFYATFAALAGAPLPHPDIHPLDSIAIGPVLEGDILAHTRQANYLHFPGYLDVRAVPNSLIIKNVGGQHYKLRYFYEDPDGDYTEYTGGHYELYNVTTDLSEKSNLLAAPVNAEVQAIAAQLSQDLRSWLDEVGAIYPTVRDPLTGQNTGITVPPPEPLPAP